ncbi:MAG TPA: hypothetical protein VML96_08045 [Egibacteraceae bacterium]|nr:hypothetical protein [Egibacteraceae bacterium]
MLDLLAHAKWFVEDPGGRPDWAFLSDPVSLSLIGAALALALAWRAVARRLPTPELGALSFLGRVAPWVPRLLGVHLGVSLLSLAVTNAYLAPNLSLDPVPAGWAIAFAEALVGVWLIAGVALRPAALAVAALGPLGMVLAGPVAVLEAADLLGIALFLALLPPGAHRYGARPVTAGQIRVPLLALRLCVGGALIVVALTEKLLNPELTAAFLEDYPALDVFALLGLDLDAAAYIRFTAAVEILFGLLIISGAAPQAAVILAGIPFNATLFFLDRGELIGHLPIYGAMLALLVYGSSRTLAPAVPWLPLSGPPVRRARTRTPTTT